MDESSISATPRELWCYARGYLFTDKDIQPPVSLWKRARVGPYYLSYDPRCEFALVSEGDRWLAMLGLAVNTRNWSMDLAGIADDALAALKEGETNLFDLLDDMSGRFVMFYSENGRARVLTDATNMRSTFYADPPHPLIISSHASLIRELTNAPPSPLIDIKWLETYTRYCLPGHFTPYDGIYYLTPNTLLELDTREVRRFFPREDLPSRQVEDIVDEMAHLFQGQLNLVAEKYNPAISISAGIDSRTTLAMSKSIADRALYFTYVVENDPHHKRSVLEIDQQVAREMADNLRLRHLLIRVRNDDDPHNLAPIQRGNSFLHHSDALARAYAEQIGEDYIHIRSNLSEIGVPARFWVARFGALKPENLAWAFSRKEEAEKDPAVVQAFAQFLERAQFDRIQNYDPYDLWYWEHRMGTWHSCVLLESDVAFDTFSPFNCRRLLTLMLSIPNNERFMRRQYLELIQKHWPVLSFWPRNRLRMRTEMYSWHRESKQQSLDKAVVTGGSLVDPNAKVGITYNAIAEEMILQHDASAPKKGDFASASVTLENEANKAYGLYMQIMSMYKNPECQGYMAYQVMLEGELLLEEDIALWRLPNSVQINWIPEKENSILEIRVVALQDCKPWQWGRASRMIIRDVTLGEVEYKGPMKSTFTSPRMRRVKRERFGSKIKRFFKE